jgi:membrane associated rhomboid family serine protease
MEALAGQIGFLILFNLFFSYVAPRISVGGHIGGLIGGVICALIIVAGERGMLGRRRLPLEITAMVAVAVVAFIGALAVV